MRRSSAAYGVRRISYLTQSYETNSGQEKGARSKTTQGEGMRSTSSWIWHRTGPHAAAVAHAPRPQDLETGKVIGLPQATP